MAKLLVIKSILDESVSTTAQITESFIKSYLEANPNDTVDTINTYELGVKPITNDNLTQMFSGTDLEIKPHAEKLTQYDKIVIAAPLWNLSIPASLKCYIDYISYAGVTFRYTEMGPIGLLKQPKVVHITSRGGMYQEPPMSNFEMGDKYLRTIMGFLGATDFSTIALEGMSQLQGEAKEAQINKVKVQASELAKSF